MCEESLEQGSRSSNGGQKEMEREGAERFRELNGMG